QLNNHSMFFKSYVHCEVTRAYGDIAIEIMMVPFISAFTPNSLVKSEQMSLNLSCERLQ
ncbi:17343_t:CDS:1, partial [Racocetra persica]